MQGGGNKGRGMKVISGISGVKSLTCEARFFSKGHACLACPSGEYCRAKEDEMKCPRTMRDLLDFRGLPYGLVCQKTTLAVNEMRRENGVNERGFS